MMRLNRLWHLAKMEVAGTFPPPSGMLGLMWWLNHHRLIEWLPVRGAWRVTEKGRESLAKAIREHEAHGNFK